MNADNPAGGQAGREPDTGRRGRDGVARAWLARKNLTFLSGTDESHARRARGFGAMAVVVSPDGIVLHLRDDKPWIPHPGLWSLFGGGVEQGEDPHETIVRELREELGLAVTYCRPLWLAVDIEGDKRLLTIFEAQTAMRASQMTLAEGRALRAFSPGEALRLGLAPFCRRVLRRLARDQPGGTMLR